MKHAAITSSRLLSRTYDALFKQIAPIEIAEAWDNVGLLVEAPTPRPNANRVFVTNDLTVESLDEALSDPLVGVIVAYHPPLFSATKRLVLSNVKSAIVLRCAAAGVSILSPHTALDNCFDGINDWLISAVRMHGVNQVTAVSPFNAGLVQTLEKQGHNGALGVGRIARLAQPQQLGTIIQNIKDFTQLSNVRVAVPKANHSDWKSFNVTSVAVCAGSGSSVLEAATADLLFTGEMSHHDVLAANARGCAVVLCEHSNTERGFLAGPFLEKLKSVIDADGESAVSVISSEADKDPLFIV